MSVGAGEGKRGSKNFEIGNSSIGGSRFEILNWTKPVLGIRGQTSQSQTADESWRWLWKS